jgi:hypothetical protein
MVNIERRHLRRTLNIGKIRTAKFRLVLELEQGPSVRLQKVASATA